VLSHIQAAKDAQAARGRAPTRGEKQLVEQAQAVAAEHAGNGAGEGQTTCYLLHSCWTYWGHSGAPLFDERGHVVALHCAWDDRTGIRHAQPLQHLIRFYSVLHTLLLLPLVEAGVLLLMLLFFLGTSVVLLLVNGENDVLFNILICSSKHEVF